MQREGQGRFRIFGRGWGHALGTERNEGRCVHWKKVSVQLKNYCRENASISELDTCSKSALRNHI